jgi:hypothetical protein
MEHSVQSKQREMEMQKEKRSEVALQLSRYSDEKPIMSARRQMDTK